MPFVWWHIIEKMESLEWMSLPLSLAITLSSEAVSMFSVCSLVSPTLYVTTILAALKVIPVKDDKESRVAWRVAVCCLWTSWLDHLGSPKFRDTHTHRQSVKALTCHNSEPGSQLQIRHQLWLSNSQLNAMQKSWRWQVSRIKAGWVLVLVPSYQFPAAMSQVLDDVAKALPLVWSYRTE